MATIRFDRQEELDGLIARVYLDTRRKLSKKALLEIIFEVGVQDYQRLVKKILEPIRSDDQKLRREFIDRISGLISLPDGIADIDPKSLWERQVE